MKSRVTELLLLCQLLNVGAAFIPEKSSQGMKLWVLKGRARDKKKLRICWIQKYSRHLLAVSPT